jgi:hypothetical protein
MDERLLGAVGHVRAAVQVSATTRLDPTRLPVDELSHRGFCFVMILSCMPSKRETDASDVA